MPEEAKKQNKDSAKAAGKVTLGIIFIIVGILATVKWWPQLITVFQGCLGLFLILVGAITIAIARD
jgi:uncharacterized membrane protein YkgB